MRSQTAERFYPFLLAAASGLASWCWDLEMRPNALQLLTATVTFGAVASGFVGTSLSILTSLDTPVMREIRATPYLDILRSYLGWALAAGITLSLTAITGLLLDMACSQAFIAAWCTMLVFCVCCLWRLGRTMLLVFGDRKRVTQSK